MEKGEGREEGIPAPCSKAIDGGRLGKHSTARRHPCHVTEMNWCWSLRQALPATEVQKHACSGVDESVEEPVIDFNLGKRIFLQTFTVQRVFSSDAVKDS